MSFSDTNRVGLYYKSETNWGDPVSGAFAQLRFTGSTLDRDKQTARSEVIRPDRMVDELAVLGFSTQGDINFELAYSSFDPFLEAAVAGTWQTITITGTFAVVAATHKITRASGSWLTDLFIPGQFVRTSGFTTPANNGVFFVTAVTATDLTLADTSNALVDEAAAAARTVKGDVLINASTKKSFGMEFQYTDIAKYQWFNGLRVSELELDFTAMQVIKGRLGLMGKDSQFTTSASTSGNTSANATPIMSASANLGGIHKDGAALTTGIKSIKLNVTNDLRKQDIVGSQAAGGIGYGGFGVKLSLDAYFEDNTLVNHVVNHDSVNLAWRVTDLNSNVIGFCIPKTKLTKGSPKVPGGNQDIMVPLEGEAIRDSATNSMIIVSRIAYL